MKLLPKVYRFVFLSRDDQKGPGTAFVIARSQSTAIKRFLELNEAIGPVAKTFTVMEESWLANVAVLFLPKYTYYGCGNWSEWMKV